MTLYIRRNGRRYGQVPVVGGAHSYRKVHSGGFIKLHAGGYVKVR